MPLGPSQSYIARYNSHTLPGYVQQEQLENSANIAAHYAPFADGSESEYTGLQNKMLSLTLKVWEPDYLSCKNEVQKAATMLRSKKNGFAPLYVQYSDRYYEAMTRKISEDKVAGTSVRTLEYNVDFECRPWLVSVSGHTITGTGTINTDQVSRTIDNGGWTPTIVTITGTNVTISGYTSTGDQAGYISVSGAVTGLVINSEDFTAEISGINKNNIMRATDYRLYVGPGKTYFTSTGASSVSITYQDRWYI